jgi:hypothetical protein
MSSSWPNTTSSESSTLSRSSIKAWSIRTLLLAKTSSNSKGTSTRCTR